jgi:hypothetical protein
MASSSSSQTSFVAHTPERDPETLQLDAVRTVREDDVKIFEEVSQTVGGAIEQNVRVRPDTEAMALYTDRMEKALPMMEYIDSGASRFPLTGRLDVEADVKVASTWLWWNIGH